MYRYFTPPRSVDNKLKVLKSTDPSTLAKNGEKKVLELVNYTLKTTPAYKKFLKDNGVYKGSINSLAEFKKLPLTSKGDYLKKYNYDDLFPRGAKDLITTISSTSGSTGEPFYFPRGENEDQQYEFVAEAFLKNQFEIDKYRTLAILGFGLGIWIGGIFTYKNLNKIAQKGCRLALAPVGTNKEIFLKTFKKTASLFEQVILMGYPPFIRDVVDEAEGFGINWKNHKIKLFTATEGYSEEFREYLIKKLGIHNRYADILNIYGSVELGTMSHETPISNLIRKIAVDNPAVFDNLFPNATIVPTLAQFYPDIVYFEEVDGCVVASGMGSSFPLIRYSFHDQGGVTQFGDMVAKLKDLGVDIIAEAKKANIADTVMHLPFVYVYGRSDFVVILRGANIYPENIKTALVDPSIEEIVTGKFTMVKREDKHFDEYLEINVELKKGVVNDPKYKDMLTDIIVKTLREKNSEFNYLYTQEGEKLTPDVVVYTYEDPTYFKDGIKHTWVKK